MPGCCAFGCTTQSGKGLAMFTVPLGKSDVARQKVWLHRIARKDFKPTKSSKLCELHFTEDQFEPLILRNFGVKKLKCTAVPSVFSHRPAKPSRKPPHARGTDHTLVTPAACSSAGVLDASDRNTAQEVPFDTEENPCTNACVMQSVVIEPPGKTVLLCTSDNAALTITVAPTHMQGTVSHSLLKSQKKPVTTTLSSVSHSQPSIGNAPTLQHTDIQLQLSDNQTHGCREQVPSTGECAHLESCISEPPRKKLRTDEPGCTGGVSTSFCSCTQDDANPQVESMRKEIDSLKRKLSGCQKRVRTLERQKQELAKGVDKHFNEDQIQSLQKTSMQGTTWSDDTVVKALKIRLACGSRGYNVVRELACPLPTERTLQRRIESFKFRPGILKEMMDLLKIKISLLCEEERHAVLMIDEIQLSKGLDFDQSTGRIIGMPSVPLSNGNLPEGLVATHGLVMMLGGLSTRWKQTVAYELTENSFRAPTVKMKIEALIEACENINVKVHAIIGDMGPCNQALWRCFGLSVGKCTQRKCYIKHPQDAARCLYFMADVPHLLKNLRSHLTRGQSIYLPDDIVEANKLPTDEVSVKPIEELIELEAGAEFKAAPRLNKACISPGHFDKMKVAPAYTFFHHDTAGALRYHVEIGHLDCTALTTAWFVDQVQKWFALMTSRTKKEALLHRRKDGINFLESIICLFQNIFIGSKGGAWKPVQTGVLLSTRSALEIQDGLFKNYGFNFLLFSRLSQDALENFFSTIRLRNPVPKPKDFKCALRSASLSQFLRPSPNGSYTTVDGEMLVGLKDQRTKPQPTSIICPTKAMLECITVDDEGAFEYLCGYVVCKVQKNFKTCHSCATAISTDKPAKDCSRLMQLKSFLADKMPLVVPTEAALRLLKAAEAFFLRNKETLLQDRARVVALKKAVIKVVPTSIPTCHDVPNKLLHCFLHTRVYLFLRKENGYIAAEKQSPRCGSRSIGMRKAADAIA